MRSSALLYFLFARASCGARGSIGQNSSDGFVFELRCRASNTHLIESLFGNIMRGVKYVVL